MEQVVACEVQHHADCGKGNATGTKLKSHLNDGTMLVKVFKRWSCYVLRRISINTFFIARHLFEPGFHIF